MISEHSSGLKVIAAPSRPAEMRSFDFEVVTRLLDLVASHFDNVVIDVPRTWFAWTDSVLIGSNRLFLVTEMTVPGLKHARHLVNVIKERLPDGPPLEVIVNRFEQRLFGPGLRRADIEQALGPSLACTIPNNFRLVSEAIDRGVQLGEVKAGNNIEQAMNKLIFPPKPKTAAKTVEPAGERKLALVR
jgi:pilus assembly protein CpaE